MPGILSMAFLCHDDDDDDNDDDDDDDDMHGLSQQNIMSYHPQLEYVWVIIIVQIWKVPNF